MGVIMRSHDWQNTSSGPPEQWPTSLKMAVRLILSIRHAMYIIWGPDLLCFYNDAFSQSLGPEQHPGSLGKPAHLVWHEVWPSVAPLVNHVISGQGAVWRKQERRRFTRRGAMEDMF